MTIMPANAPLIDCYWFIAGDTTQVFSSARAAVFPITDSAYVAWLAAGFTTTPIDTFANLYDVLLLHAPAAAAAVSSAWLAASHLTPEQGLAVMFSKGVVITSTGTPAVNGTYGIDPANQAKIAFVWSYIQGHSIFPGGFSTVSHADLAGIGHVFPTTTLFQAFATAVADFVTQVDEAYTAGSAWPSNAKTII